MDLFPQACGDRAVTVRVPTQHRTHLGPVGVRVPGEACGDGGEETHEGLTRILPIMGG